MQNFLPPQGLVRQLMHGLEIRIAPEGLAILENRDMWLAGSCCQRDGKEIVPSLPTGNHIKIKLGHGINELVNDGLENRLLLVMFHDHRSKQSRQFKRCLDSLLDQGQ